MFVFLELPLHALSFPAPPPVLPGSGPPLLPKHPASQYDSFCSLKSIALDFPMDKQLDTFMYFKRFLHSLRSFEKHQS